MGEEYTMALVAKAVNAVEGGEVWEESERFEEAGKKYRRQLDLHRGEYGRKIWNSRTLEALDIIGFNVSSEVRGDSLRSSPVGCFIPNTNSLSHASLLAVAGFTIP